MVVPAPAHRVERPSSWAERAMSCPTGWMPSGNASWTTSPGPAPMHGQMRRNPTPRRTSRSSAERGSKSGLPVAPPERHSSREAAMGWMQNSR